MPSAARRRQRPGGGRRRARRRPVDGAPGAAPARACGCRAASTGTRPRSGRCSVSRSRWPGRSRWPASSSRATATSCRRPSYDGPRPAVPERRGARRGRPRGAADAAGPRPCPGGPVRAPSPTVTSRWTAAPTAPTSRARLLALPGIGPWTADYVAMRALGDPDVFLPTDVGVRRALAGLGLPRRCRVRRRAEPALAALALLRAHAPVVDARPADRARTTDPTSATTRRTDMWTVVDSPAGPIRVIAQRRRGHRHRVHRRPARGRHARAPRCGWPPTRSAGATGRRPRRRRPAAASRRRRQLTAYFARDLKEFDLPLRPAGTAVPAAGVGPSCSAIGYGETASYGELADRLGMPRGASRAVGAANGRNPIGIVIPCHRVVGANGSLSGYAGGRGAQAAAARGSSRTRCSDADAQPAGRGSRGRRSPGRCAGSRAAPARAAACRRRPARSAATRSSAGRRRPRARRSRSPRRRTRRAASSLGRMAEPVERVERLGEHVAVRAVRASCQPCRASSASHPRVAAVAATRAVVRRQPGVRAADRLVPGQALVVDRREHLPDGVQPHAGDVGERAHQPQPAQCATRRTSARVADVLSPGGSSPSRR